MDVEDHEISVLRGATAAIAAARPFVVFENWLIRDRPSATLDPLHWFEARDYCFFHAGWAAEAPDCVVPDLRLDPDGGAILVLLPFPVAQRFHLPAQLNVLAVPRERLGDLRRRVEGGAAGFPSPPAPCILRGLREG